MGQDDREAGSQEKGLSITGAIVSYSDVITPHKGKRTKYTVAWTDKASETKKKKEMR